MIVIGIDPGGKGGIGWIDDTLTKGNVDVRPMPETPKQIFDLLHGIVEDEVEVHAFLEKAQSFPKQGIASAYNYGHHNGFLEGALTALAIPYTLVKPNVWMKRMHAGADSKLDTKDRSIQVCQRLFPTVSLLPTPKCKKPADGMAEALLIAEDGRRETLRLTARSGA